MDQGIHPWIPVPLWLVSGMPIPLCRWTPIWLCLLLLACEKSAPVEEQVPDAPVEAAEFQEDPTVEPQEVPSNPMSGIPVYIDSDGGCWVAGEQVTMKELAWICHERLALDPDTHLHLFGESETVFKYSRSVIRAVSKAGVERVVFDKTSWPESPDLREWVERARKAALDSSIEESALKKFEAPPVEATVLVVILMGDRRMKAQEMEQSFEEFEESLLEVVARATDTRVQLYVPDDVPQSEVIALLNILTKAEITTVTLTDLIE